VTPRGKLALGFGFGIYVAAWAFGSQPLYPVAVGLMLAIAFAWGWVRLAVGPAELRREAGRGGEEEGDDVEVDLLLPYSRGDLLSKIHQQGEVQSVAHVDVGSRVRALVNPRLAGELQEFAAVDARD